MPLAGLAGGICGGPFIMFLGRKTTIQIIGVPFMAAGVLIGCAMNVTMVLGGRFLAGFCVGVASLALPVYLGETLHPEVRGTLGCSPRAWVTLAFSCAMWPAPSWDGTTWHFLVQPCSFPTSFWCSLCRSRRAGMSAEDVRRCPQIAHLATRQECGCGSGVKDIGSDPGRSR